MTGEQLSTALSTHLQAEDEHLDAVLADVGLCVAEEVQVAVLGALDHHLRLGRVAQDGGQQ